jgi:hypothetical protein
MTQLRQITGYDTVQPFVLKHIPDHFRTDRIYEVLKKFKGVRFEASMLGEDDVVDLTHEVFPPKFATDSSKRSVR